ncbi:hypothetical protein A2U01_0115399, partial [Trifolium medium]|nr:hypothetical protein [Trifolium medium]
LTTAHRLIKDLIALGTKELKGFKAERGNLATNVAKKGTMPMTVENQGL